MGEGLREPDSGPVVWSGDPAGRATAAVLAAQARVVEEMVPRYLDQADVEALHDLRVAVRRSRTVLRRLGQVFPPEARRRHTADLRWVQAVTGGPRDLDVLLQRWDDLVGGLPVELAGDLAKVADRLRARRAEAFEALAATLTGPEMEDRWASWRKLVDTLPDRSDLPEAAGVPMEQVAARRIDVVNRRVQRDAVRVDGGTTATALHDLRKRGKQLRYLLELFGETCLPVEIVRVGVHRLKAVQDDLGRHQDDEVHGDLLASLPSAVSPDGLHRLLDRLAADKREARHRLTGSLLALTAVQDEIASALRRGRG